MTAAASVHLALGRVSQTQDRMPAGDAWLSAEERERLGSLRAPQRRAQFIAGRLLMRQLLQATHGRSLPEDWPLSATANQPVRRLDPDASGPAFLGLSHSAGDVVCACGPVPFGVDIESTATARDFMALAGAVATASEQQRMLALPMDARARGFYTLWTLKEAWIKACGDGMTPGRLALLETRAVSEDDSTANAWLWEGPDFLLALVQPAESAPVDWVIGAQVLRPAGRWSVRPAGAVS